MAKRKLSRVSKIERMYKIWDYLSKHTDSEHTITQAKLRKVPEVAEYIGGKQAFNQLIKDMAKAMNSAEYGWKQEEEWKIYFRDFKSFVEDDELDEDINEIEMRLTDLYYNQTFSYDEINSLIEGVLSTKTIDTNTAAHLIEKIEDNLTTEFYKRGPKRICKMMEPELVDRNTLKNNLLLIQKAIDENIQISFRFNGYTRQKKLEPIRDVKDTVSPYYIVASGGRYYLLACKEMKADVKVKKSMSIWRIDLMTEMEIPEMDVKRDIKGKLRTPKSEVENLPMEWSEDFQLKHLNMSYDKPEWITLRIRSKKYKDDTKRSVTDYTFIHDWFGNQFRYVRTEKEEPYDDIVKVECSPYAMVNWALQYSDRVEVVEPDWVRDKVVDKVRKLNEKYAVRGE